MYEHMQIRNCNNLHVVGDAVMYNSLARLPFTQATIVGVSKSARDLTFQVIARAGYHACCPARSVSHTVFSGTSIALPAQNSARLPDNMQLKLMLMCGPRSACATNAGSCGVTVSAFTAPCLTKHPPLLICESLHAVLAGAGGLCVGVAGQLDGRPVRRLWRRQQGTDLARQQCAPAMPHADMAVSVCRVR